MSEVVLDAEASPHVINTEAMDAAVRFYMQAMVRWNFSEERINDFVANVIWTRYRTIVAAEAKPESPE